jgi:hypothetical protein
MTDTTTATVTPLRPATDPGGPVPSQRARKPRAKRADAARRIDPTNAARQRRHRTKRKMVAILVDPTSESNVTLSSPTMPVAPPATSIPDVPSRRIGWSVYPLAFTTIALMGVSLTHLSDGVVQLTNSPVWQGWAMALGIDAMLIAVALALLTATAEVKRDISKVAHVMEIGTLGMSAYLNALAFTGGAFDMGHATQVLFGCFVPAAISGATYILARLTRGTA